jgi:phenylalanyl-tRNA synthetase beta chain
VCTETRLLWAVACGHDRAPSWAEDGRSADPLFLKGLVAEIASELGLDLQIAPASPDHPLHDLLHPNRQARITLGSDTVGVLGEIHPALLREMRIKRARPVYLQIDQEALERQGGTPPFVEPSDLQPIVRNLAFTLPLGVEAGRVATALRDAGPAWLADVGMSDVFEHEDAGRPVRTVTFDLVFEVDAAPRTAEEVNAICEALIAAIEARFADQGVKLRA